MSYSPYIPDIEAWRKQYALNNKMESKQFYTIKSSSSLGDIATPPPLKMITPTQQVVDQAKSEIRTETHFLKKPSKKGRRSTPRIQKSTSKSRV